MRTAQNVYLPPLVQASAVGKLIDSAVIQTGDSELEIRDSRSSFPRRSWEIGWLPEDVLEVEAMYRVFQRTESFLFQPPRPIDYTAEEQNIGTGTGALTAFQLRLSETVGNITAIKTIKHPVAATVHIFLSGSPLTEDTHFSVGAGGIITMDTPPGNGVIVYASFEYDTPVRFDSTELSTTVIQHLDGDTDAQTIQLINKATIIEVFNE